MRGLWCFMVRAKLTPRFIGPIKITEERRRIEGIISFLIHPNLGDEIHFKEGRFVTPQNSKF
jgi:hypothetical protein